jgi:hypothetical protein
MNEVLLSGLKLIIMGEIWLIYTALHCSLHVFLLVLPYQRTCETTDKGKGEHHAGN